MRRRYVVGVTLILLALCLTLAACSGSKGDVRADATSTLDGIKHSDPSALDMLGEQLSVGEQFGIADKEFVSSWLEGFTYSIDSVDVQGDSASVKVTVSCRQLKSAVDESLPEIGLIMADPPDDADMDALYAQCGKVLLDKLKTEPLISSSLVLGYHLEEGVWSMDTTSQKDLAQVLAGGMA